MKPPVSSKVDYYRRRQNLEFGNALQTWNTWGDLLRSDYEGPIGIRNTTPGGPFVCPIPYGQWYNEYRKLLDSGVNKEDMRFGQAAPDHAVVFQAEVMESHRGLELRYAVGSGKTHREAMREARNMQGLSALLILRHYTPPSDLADIEALLELYPDHVIEFSTYSIPVGDVPCRSAIIWEVRRF